MKHFRAKVENAWEGCHAMQIFFDAPNIIEAAGILMDKLSYLCIDSGDIKQLVEINAEQL